MVRLAILDTGTGCPQGSVGYFISENQSLLTLGFDQFVATIGPNATQQAQRTTNCQLHLDLQYPGGCKSAIVTRKRIAAALISFSASSPVQYCECSLSWLCQARCGCQREVGYDILLFRERRSNCMTLLFLCCINIVLVHPCSIVNSFRSSTLSLLFKARPILPMNCLRKTTKLTIPPTSIPLAARKG